MSYETFALAQRLRDRGKPARSDSRREISLSSAEIDLILAALRSKERDEQRTAFAIAWQKRLEAQQD